MEAQLARTFKAKADLYNKAVHDQSQKYIADYLSQHLSLTVNGKKMELSMLGFEIEKDHLMVYYETPYEEAVKKIVVVNDVLYEYSKEQMHIIHYKANGKTRSGKILNPDKTLTFDLTK